jgi:hypothetical protein
MAEAIREYRLTPDDVHDSLNLWMHTYWTEEGTMRHPRAIGPPGDYVDLLALMDVLAVPVTCGSGDIGQLSNFSFKPIRIQVLEATAMSRTRVSDYLANFGGYANQIGRERYRVRNIKADRELRRVPGFEPRFKRFPISTREIAVTMDAETAAKIVGLVGRLGKSPAEVTRALFMFWYLANRAKPPLLRP